jgi:hypothetical protein
MKMASLKQKVRKQVYCMYFNSLAEIEEAKKSVNALLFEAELIDERLWREKESEET